MTTEGDKGLSVIVCCYNSEQRIAATIERLCHQAVPAGADFEILLIDNNCDDGTVEVASEVAARCGASQRLRVLRESRPGLSFARHCGVHHSRFPWVAFVDDDNHCADDWLSEALALAESMPELGMIGSTVRAKFESDPPAWAVRHSNLLACDPPRPATASPTDWQEVDTVAGAGMVIRRSAFWDAIGSSEDPRMVLTDRCGVSLSGGGDIELCYRVRAAGWKIAHSPRLVIDHLIPPQRTTSEYLARLLRGFSDAEIPLKFMRMSVAGTPIPSGLKLRGWLIARQLGITAVFLKKLVVASADREVNLHSVRIAFLAIPQTIFAFRRLSSIRDLIVRDFESLRHQVERPARTQESTLQRENAEIG